MANPIWITGQNTRLVNLGTVTEGTYFEVPLDSYDPLGGPVTYKFLAGQLPPGIRINGTGLIQGGPYLNTVNNQTQAFEFSVRATDQHGLVADKSFILTVTNINPPVISTRITDLGQVFDGSYFNFQLTANELNPNAALTWSLASGSLPAGVSLSSAGLISGFILPLPTTSSGGTQGYNAAPYNEFSYENAPTYQNNTYKFTVKVFDGANYDSLTYTLKVTVKSQFTADSTFNTIDGNHLTIDHDNVYVPIIVTPSQMLPEVRSNSKFAFKFDAIDPTGHTILYSLSLASAGNAGWDQSGTQGFDTIGFDQENLSAPPGLVLDPSTGWFVGTVGAQAAAVQEYTFQVFAYDALDSSRASLPVTYKMVILGDITNTITWTTGSDLGVIQNGSISQLSVSAVNNSGRDLTYSLVPDTSHLPQGLTLQRSGLIVGQAGFEYFTLDHGATTVDKSTSLFDNSYTFTVQATSIDGTATSTKDFTVLVDNVNMTPYENVYLKALPTKDQRTTFLNVVNNKDIFPEELIYRPTDPNFGRARDIRSLFLAGLEPSEVSTYVAAMTTNTYNKKIEFGTIKTAQAVDANFNVKYEVVYVELEDNASFKGKTPANSKLDLDINRIIYPNSFANMQSVISNATGYANFSVLPDWMTSPQENKKQLGFKQVVVLAYTKPGASKLIAYRLGASQITFNSINFVLDRYDLDNRMSANFNTTTQRFNLGDETTFDRIQRPGPIAVCATYGVSGVPFNKINNRTVAQINANGGLDGVTKFVDGETMVFIQQENYPGVVDNNDGWTNGSDIIPGWTEFVNSMEIPPTAAGFPSNPVAGQVALHNGQYFIFSNKFDSNGNIIDLNWKVANLRANIWQINIDSNNLVTLTPKVFTRVVGQGTSAIRVTSMIMPSDRVQINHGASRSETIVFYNIAFSVGFTVPVFTNIPTLLSNAKNVTRFDNYGTRFINNRLTYSDPGTLDVWLKFPNNGPLL
jgi:Putative Ig domain